MGNILPCLVRSTTTPTMDTTTLQRSHSIDLLARTIHMVMQRRRCHTETSPVAGGRRRKHGAAMAAQRARRSEVYHGKKNLQPAEAGVVRVKVVLTRKEAARLASLAGGRRRTAVQLVRELRRMEDDDAAGGGVDGSPATGWRPVLETISE